LRQFKEKDEKRAEKREEKKLAALNIPHILYCTAHTASWQTVAFTSEGTNSIA
jgi:hypothetical protein